MKKWFVDEVFVRKGKMYDWGFYIREDGIIEWHELPSGDVHEFPIEECTFEYGTPIMIEDGKLLGEEV
jgi:hypothetical protein